MTDIPINNATPDDELLKDVPYETLPTLAANEHAVSTFDQLRALKLRMDADEEEYQRLKLEAGALVAASGVKSIAYIDLRIGNAEGGTVKGKVTGARILDAAGNVLTPEQIQSIALAAKDCDETALAMGGIPAHLIAAGREPGRPRAASTRIEWIGSKGKGGKRRAAGSGGQVQ